MKLKTYLRIFALSFVNILALPSHANDLNIISFNLEAEGSNIYVLANQLEKLSSQRKVDIWLFSDINPEWTDELTNAVAIGSEIEVDFVPGNAGKTNRCLIVFNKERFEVLKISNLGSDYPYNQHPLALVKFRDRASGKSFLTLLNPQASTRYISPFLAEDLNSWARTINEPVIAVGHFGFTLPVSPQDASSLDKQFLKMVKDDIFGWMRPMELLPNYCARQNAIFDFILIAESTNTWSGKTEIIPMTSNYCDDHRDNTHDSSHRPVFASITTF